MRSGDERHVTLLPAEHELVDEVSVGVERAFAWAMIASSSLLASSHSISFVTFPFLHDAIRRLDEAEVVHARVAGERRDQSDVRTFRRFDRAHAAVLRVMHVADFEAGALTREAARSERRQTTLVRQLGQRVGLIHELRQLRRSEERLNHRADTVRALTRSSSEIFLRIGVDRHALLDQPRHARETDGELIRDQLTNRANAAVAQVIDVVDMAASFVQLDEVADDRDEIFLREHRLFGRRVEAEPLVDLVAAHATEIVALGREEQTLERLLGRLQFGRVARTEQRVDLLQRLLLARASDPWRACS